MYLGGTSRLWKHLREVFKAAARKELEGEEDVEVTEHAVAARAKTLFGYEPEGFTMEAGVCWNAQVRLESLYPSLYRLLVLPPVSSRFASLLG